VAVMVQFWMAGRLGKAWLALRPGLRANLGELPGDCALVALGKPLSADRLWRVQDFAVRVWWRFGMASWLMFFPVLGIEALLRPGRIGTDVGVVLGFAMACAATASMAQAGMIRYQSMRVMQYLLEADPQAESEPLPRDAPGSPRPYDFWVMLAIAVGVFGIMLYAATRSGTIE
jgi:hypothetical protein